MGRPLLEQQSERWARALHRATSESQGLTLEEENAIDLLVTGATDRDVAEAVGVHRVTITRWRNYDPHFQASLNRRRKEIWSSSTDRLRALLPRALDRLERELEEIPAAQLNGRAVCVLSEDELDELSAARRDFTTRVLEHFKDIDAATFCEGFDATLRQLLLSERVRAR